MSKSKLAYTDIFVVAVPVLDGHLDPSIKNWFEVNGSPVLEEGDRIFIAEGSDWEAFTGDRVYSGKVPLRFRFRNSRLATMFKLTWG